MFYNLHLHWKMRQRGRNEIKGRNLHMGPCLSLCLSVFFPPTLLLPSLSPLSLIYSPHQRLTSYFLLDSQVFCMNLHISAGILSPSIS